VTEQSGPSAEQSGSAAGHSRHGEFHSPGPWPVVGAELTLAAGESRHACRALRVRSGDRIRLVDGEGRAGAALVVRADARGVRVRLLEIREVEREDPWPWELALPRLRARGRMDWAIEKATELGCRRFHLFEAARSVRAGRGSREARAERWRALALAAMKQSGRAWCPPIVHHDSLVRLLAQEAGRARVLYGDPGGLRVDALAAFRRGETLLLVVGPEGGLTAEESTALAAARGEPVRLGPHRLRSEGAAIALAAVVAASLPAADGPDAGGPATGARDARGPATGGADRVGA